MFETVLGELSAILPDIAKTRWRKKSDFYTLCLTFAAQADNMPLASDKRVVKVQFMPLVVPAKPR